MLCYVDRVPQGSAQWLRGMDQRAYRPPINIARRAGLICASVTRYASSSSVVSASSSFSAKTIAPNERARHALVVEAVEFGLAFVGSSRPVGFFHQSSLFMLRRVWMISLGEPGPMQITL